MEIKSCEQYVITRLNDLEWKVNRLEVENHALRTQYTPTQRVLMEYGRKCLWDCAFRDYTHAYDDESFLCWAGHMVDWDTLPDGIDGYDFVREYGDDLRGEYAARQARREEGGE